MRNIPNYKKDPDEKLDYLFDFTAKANGRGNEDLLVSGEIIMSKQIVSPSGITVESSQITDSNTSVTVWLSGGTIHNSYEVTARVTTSDGRIYDRSIKVSIKPA